MCNIFLVSFVSIILSSFPNEFDCISSSQKMFARISNENNKKSTSRAAESQSLQV